MSLGVVPKDCAVSSAVVPMPLAFDTLHKYSGAKPTRGYLALKT